MQIDLYLPTRVEGLRIFNWLELKEHNGQLGMKGLGVYHFALQFGLILSDLKHLNIEKVFFVLEIGVYHFARYSLF